MNKKYIEIKIISPPAQTNSFETYKKTDRLTDRQINIYMYVDSSIFKIEYELVNVWLSMFCI